MRFVWFVSLIGLGLGGAAFAAVPDEGGIQFFENRVRPLLVEQCYQCHSATSKKLKGNLYVDSREGLIKGGDSGPAIIPGKPDQGKLAEAISWANVDLQMPPKKKLSAEQIADLTKWMAMGAPWPQEAPKQIVATKPAFDLEARKAAHWCWRPITRVTPPDVTETAWAPDAIDRFILAQLEKTGLKHSPPAEKHTLIRRAYFDLIGLPPTPAEVQAFESDASPDAFAKVVDHLLASEHFGERWARHWMDLVRFGETRGHEFDPYIPNAWQYRDYLIRAFNADVPYDQFVTEHLAGDLLPHPRLNPDQHFSESLLGTGFWFLGEEVHSPVDIRQDEADRLSNRLDTMTKAFLGLTVGCARCHDHKFDAISQKDFYALQGFLLSAGYRQAPFETMERNRKVAADLDALRKESGPALLAECVAARRPAVSRLASYLMAAAQALAPIAHGGDAEVAADRNIDPSIVAAWAAELAIAVKDDKHLFHDFAVQLFDRSRAGGEGFAALQTKLKAQREKRRAKFDDQPAIEQTLLDFSHPESSPWYVDGVAFGQRPVHLGELLLGAEHGDIVAGVATRDFARRDPACADFEPAPHTQSDEGRLVGLHRAGQTIRTLKVSLKTGKLWYLTRGKGTAYAVVDSHLMINGPLHGKVVAQINGSNAWHWMPHDLSEYAGHRCHVEFSPRGDGVFEVARVVEADRAPALESPNAIVESAVAASSVNSLESMAQAYQSLCIAAVDHLAAGTIRAADDAGIADFIVRNRALFVADTSSAKAASRFAAEQSKLAKGFEFHSHTALAMLEGNGVDETLLVRGMAKNVGPAVPRRFLEAIAGPNQAPYPADGSGRLRLAGEMLASTNPFPARVMANRVWQHLFGRGIVPTVDNMGVLGQPPTHPELLDYLAESFRADDAWSVKKLIRSIMLSNAYQMSSKAIAASEAADPENLHLHHMPIRRLESEPIRDGILAVAGQLNPQVGGPPVDVYLTGFMEGRGRPHGGPMDGEGRRSIYTIVRRNFLPPMMLAFDEPIPFACVGRRNVSNVPAQALILMNDPLVAKEAELWAKNLLEKPDQSAEARITTMYQAGLGRAPRATEAADAMAFLQSQAAEYGLVGEQQFSDVRPWADLCHVMFNLKEFIFIE